MDEANLRQAGVPVRADGRRSHEELLTAAREAFAEQGTEASLREVARRAGVSIATLYRHFPTRETLIEAVLGQGFDALSARADELVAAPDPVRALVAWIRDLAAAIARYEGLPAAVMGALHDPDSTLHASCARLGVTAKDLLTRAQDAGRVRADLTAGELLTAVNAMAWAAGQSGRGDGESDGDGSGSGDGATNRLVDLFVEGLLV